MVYMNQAFLKSPIRRFRSRALAEGFSFILLLLEMPVKYVCGHPEGEKCTGWVHGLLFIRYIISLLQVKINYQWSFWKSFVAFFATLLLIRTFVFDLRMRKEEAEFILLKAEQ